MLILRIQKDLQVEIKVMI